MTIQIAVEMLLAVIAMILLACYFAGILEKAVDWLEAKWFN